MDYIAITNQLQAQLQDKGYLSPEVRLSFAAGDAEPTFNISYKIFKEELFPKSEYFWGHSGDAMGRAETFITDLPHLEAVIRRTAFQRLSDAVATAQAAGIDFQIKYAEGKKPVEHKATVVLGCKAVDEYCRGETQKKRLRSFGALQHYKFTTLGEMNAFMLGVDVAAGSEDAIAVDDI